MSARPPGVVSGLPNMTPIFSRSWLVKTSAVFDRVTAPVSLRSAWLMSRAWMPTNESPISPSISARGTSAATESTTTTVDAAGADERLGDLERLLAGVGLADEQLVDVDAAGAGVAGIERVLDVDEGGDAALALGLGDDVLADRGLARRLRAEDLGDPAARDAADAEGEVERDRAGRDGVDVLALARAELHDRAAPELLLDRGQGGVDRLAALREGPFRGSLRRFARRSSPSVRHAPHPIHGTARRSGP